MKLLFKLCSVIYRIVLSLVLPVFVVAQVLVGAAGHSADPKWHDYLLVTVCVTTVILLTILFHLDKEDGAVRNIIRYASIILVSISVAFEVYGLYDLCSESDFSKGDTIGIAIFLLFTLISITVLWGIIKDRD
jgi:hypothetical protein